MNGNNPSIRIHNIVLSPSSYMNIRSPQLMKFTIMCSE